MVARLPDFVLNQIVTLHYAGWSPKSIRKVLNIGHGTVYQLIKNLDGFGEFYPPTGRRRGRLRSLDDEAEEYLAGRPTAYLDEVQDMILDEFNVALSLPAIHYMLKRRKWSRKKAEKRALERSEPLRAVWRGRRMIWSRRRLVFIDESGANERTGSRKYGWSPKGMSCADYESITRSERWSILPAMTVDGYIGDPLIYQGGINAEIFCAWLQEDVLPQLSEGSILVMDNASIHRSHELLGASSSSYLRIRQISIR
ncbi:hypothetical protein E4T43_09511 [Aureobasidium subglaciale]|nr:hypothetical protein E4T43_09511 [Aureobasidium subglaciale]